MTTDKTTLAGTLHHLADLMIERELTDDTCRAAVTALARLADDFRQHDVRSLDSRVEQFVTQMAVHGDHDIADGAVFSSFDESPYSGTVNALAPQSVTYRRVGDTVQASVLLGIALEGRPGRAHGGAVAAVFDDVMGALQHIIKRNGYTRTLSTTYLAPFPTDVVVDIVASCTSIDGERFTIEATASVEDRAVATATGDFTAIDVERWRRA